MEYFTNLNNRPMSRSIGFSPLGIRFNSGEEFNVKIGNQYEFLTGEEVISSIAVKSGIYNRWQYSTLLSTAQRRNVRMVLNHTWGRFYDGRRRTTLVQSGYIISVPLFVGLELEYTDGTLSRMDFIREVYRLRANVPFSPSFTLNSFIQYDNHTRNMGWQSRFR